MRDLLIGLCILGIISCGEIEPQKTSAYFSIDSLISKQESLLLSKKAKLFKSVYSSKDSATSTTIPDSIGWANEFRIARELDINKPALIGRYTITKKEDDSSNLEILRYEANSKELEIQFLEVYFLVNLDDIKRIKAESSESNSIFKSTKSIELELDHINQDLHIRNYKIEGFQKMILQDSVKFRVEGKITY